MTLSYVPRVLTAHENVLERSANMTSSESNEINAVEVDGIQFETLVPERMLCLPKKKSSTENSEYFEIFITNTARIFFP